MLTVNPLTSVLQSNFPVATKLLKDLHGEAKMQSGRLQRWVHSYSHFSHKRCLTQGPMEQVTTMLKCIPLLGKAPPHAAGLPLQADGERTSSS